MSFLPTDIPDLRGYDSGVVLSNLSRLRTREERLGEQILAQLWELAGAVMQDAAGDPDTLTSILLALQSDREEPRAIPGQDVLTVSMPAWYCTAIWTCGIRRDVAPSCPCGMCRPRYADGLPI